MSAYNAAKKALLGRKVKFSTPEDFTLMRAGITPPEIEMPKPRMTNWIPKINMPRPEFGRSSLTPQMGSAMTGLAVGAGLGMAGAYASDSNSYVGAGLGAGLGVAMSLQNGPTRMGSAFSRGVDQFASSMRTTYNRRQSFISGRSISNFGGTKSLKSGFNAKRGNTIGR